MNVCELKERSIWNYGEIKCEHDKEEENGKRQIEKSWLKEN